MEGPISKFIHVQQPDAFWHQPSNTSAFKSPDLIELHSDSERNITKKVEPANYSSSQEEVETEDDCCEPTQTILVSGVAHDEESCHLLQTEDDSEGSESEHGENSSKSSSHSSTSAEVTISDNEGEGRGSKVRQGSFESYWEMTGEQELYYTEQFTLLQPDLNGLVSGVVAKGFFEKSKLPPVELRDIWQISDVSQDGCLDLGEFKMAMHLVVLRRHGLPIPSHFYGKPPRRGSNLNGGAQGTSPMKSRSAVTSGPNSISGPPGSHSEKSRKSIKEEWTTFENEPVNFSSTCDTSGLVAPVPLRLTTPDDKMPLSNSVTHSLSKTQNLQLKGIQRPKLSGHHPKISTGTIAPPPPPRRKTHVRSSSLDLNRLSKETPIGRSAIMESHHHYLKSEGRGMMGPEVPARTFLSPSGVGGAFSVYRKQAVPSTATIHEPPTDPTYAQLPVGFGNKCEVEQEVADLKNENSILNRISTQLLDQLAGLQAKRRALNFKILQLASVDPPAIVSPDPKFP